MTRGERAEKLFYDGHNCSQAVVGAFADVIGMEEKTAMKLLSGFGGGMGRMRETCGAVSGAVFVISALFGYDDTDDNKKKELYRILQGFLKGVKEQKGSLNCAELLQIRAKERTFEPEKRTPEFYKTRPCAKIIFDVAEALEKYLTEIKVI